MHFLFKLQIHVLSKVFCITNIKLIFHCQETILENILGWYLNYDVYQINAMHRFVLVFIVPTPEYLRSWLKLNFYRTVLDLKLFLCSDTKPTILPWDIFIYYCYFLSTLSSSILLIMKGLFVSNKITD